VTIRWSDELVRYDLEDALEEFTKSATAV